ncbi:MAG: type II secretion system F family protein [Vulcanimicrobiota bacterium]
MIYDFKVTDGDGSLLEGDLDAISEEQARLLLRKEFPNLRSIIWLKPQPLPKARPYKVPPGDVVIFFRRLAVMLDSGVTIDRALTFLAESTDGPLVVVIEKLQQHVSRGDNLLVALNQPEMSRVFSPLARGLVGTGLKTGALAESLVRLAEITERRYGQRRAFLGALAYPAIVSLAIGLLGIGFLVFIAPGELGIYAALGSTLPLPTRILVALSEFVRNPMLWAVLLAALGLAGPPVYLALRPGTPLRRALDRRVLGLPFFGPLWEKATAAEVLHIWSSSLRVGVPLSEGIGLSLPTVSNSEILGRLMRANLELRDGSDFGEALRIHRVFPQLVTSMISLGFESGQLDSMLQRVSELYEEDVNGTIEQVAKVIEPILLGVAGLLAAFVALACLMPMLQLGSSL